jgi:hypothetical protein
LLRGQQALRFIVVNCTPGVYYVILNLRPSVAARVMALLMVSLSLAGCGGSGAVVPGGSRQHASALDSLQLPPGGHTDSKGRAVDSYGRLLSWDAANHRWLSLTNHWVLPTSMGPSAVRAVQTIDCSIATASNKRRVRGDCIGSTDTGGAITAPVPDTVTSMTDQGNGWYNDQNGNNWSYCYDCTSPDNGDGSTRGEWLQQIGEVQANNTTAYVAVAFIEGLEDLSMGPYVEATANPPSAYKNYPFRDYIYFNANHFWKQHLACYFASTQSQFIDGVTQDLNGHLMSGASGLYNSYTFTYHDPNGVFTIQYNVWHFPWPIGDYLVGTAYIVPQRPKCPGT